MLSTLRKQSKSVITYVLFGMIIVVFVFTFNVASPDMGCGGQSSRKSQTLVTIGKTAIELPDLMMGLALSIDPPSPSAKPDMRVLQQELYYRSTRFARLREDEKYQGFGQDPMKVSLIKSRKVMDDLIETFLVSEEAMKLGLRASDEDVRQRVLQEFTDSDGNFKKSQYENYVRFSLRTSISRFESFLRREILRERMIDLITAGVVVPQREVSLAGRASQTKKVFEFLEFSPEIFSELVDVSDKEIKDYISTHEEELKKFFDENKEAFKVETQYAFHVMKFKAASRAIIAQIGDEEQKKSLQESWKVAKDAAEKAYNELKDKEGDALVQAFEELAKKVSDDTSTREHGGKTSGLVSQSSLDPALVSVIEKAQKGALLGPVPVDDGYLIVILDEKVEGKDRSFEEVKDEIAKRRLAEEKVMPLMERVVSRALEMAKNEPKTSLEEIQKTLNKEFEPKAPVKYGQTKPFALFPEGLREMAQDEGEAVSGIGESKELHDTIYALTKEKPFAPKVFEVSGSKSKFLVRLYSEDVPTAMNEDAGKKFAQELLAFKRRAWYREWFETLRAQAISEGRLVEHPSFLAIVEEEAKTLQETQARKVSEENP
jgi:parvulin-like peptidyl-prolyl isomerase